MTIKRISCVVGLLTLAGCASADQTAGTPRDSGSGDPAQPGDGSGSGDGASDGDDSGDGSAPADGDNSGDGAADGADGAGDGDTDGSTADGDDPADGNGGDGDPSSELDGGLSGDASGDGDGSGDGEDIEEFCSGKGPVIEVQIDDEEEDVCSGTIARRVFKNAICSCENVAFAGALDTTSFSSAENTTDEEGNPVVETGFGGNVGVNGAIDSAGAINIGGHFRVAGSLRLTDEIDIPNLNAGAIWVHGDMETQKPFWLAGALAVDRDIYAKEGGIVAGVVVADHLYTPANTVVAAALPILNWETKDFDLEEPCPCNPEELISVPHIVEKGSLHNDNANPAFDAEAFKVLGPIEALTIPCGRYYLDGSTTWDVASLGIGAVYIKVLGRAALYVDGDLIVTGALWFDLAPGAELDLFIKGNLVLTGATAFGNLARPADFRVYVGGESGVTGMESAVVLTGAQAFGANLYAPKSFINSEGAIFARGSIFGKNIHADGAIHVDYDRDVLERGDDEECLPPPAPETDAGTPPEPQCVDACDEKCGSVATCIDGACAPCVNDSDCCAPLVCYENGQCGPILL